MSKNQIVFNPEQKTQDGASTVAQDRGIAPLLGGGELRPFAVASKNLKAKRITCTLDLSSFILPDGKNYVRTLKQLNAYFCYTYGLKHIKELGQRAETTDAASLKSKHEIGFYLACKDALKMGNHIMFGYFNDASANPIERFIHKYGITAVVGNTAIQSLQECNDNRYDDFQKESV